MRRLADLVLFLPREFRFLDLGCEPFPLRYFEENSKNSSHLFASTLKNSWRIIMVSLACSLLLRAKLSCKFKSIKVHLCTTRKCWEMPFLSKNCGSFSQKNVWTGDFALQDELVLFPFAKKHSKWFFFFPPSFSQITFRHFEIVICQARFSLRLSHDT